MEFFLLGQTNQNGVFCGIREDSMDFGWDINVIMWMPGYVGIIGLGFIEVGKLEGSLG